MAQGLQADHPAAPSMWATGGYEDEDDYDDEDDQDIVKAQV